MYLTTEYKKRGVNSETATLRQVPASVGLLLGQRRGWWPVNKLTLQQHLKHSVNSNTNMIDFCVLCVRFL